MNNHQSHLKIDFSFAGQGWPTYLYWLKNDRKTLKRINRLIKSINRDGMSEGLGKPEPLKHRPLPTYPRRINKRDRLVYANVNGIPVIVSCKGHYE